MELCLKGLRGFKAALNPSRDDPAAETPIVSVTRGPRNVGRVSEILFLGIFGLVVFGPKKLAELGQHVGRALAAFRKTTDEFKSQLGNEIAAAEGPLPITARHEISPSTQTVAHLRKLPRTPPASTRDVAPSLLVQSERADLSLVLSNIDQTSTLYIAYPEPRSHGSSPQMDKVIGQAWVAKYESPLSEFNPSKVAERISVAEKQLTNGSLSYGMIPIIMKSGG